MSFPKNKMASGRKTSGMIQPRVKLNLSIPSDTFPIPINTSARQKICKNAIQNSQKIPQPCSSGAVTIKAVRFAPYTGYSSEQRKSLSTVTDISEIPSSSLKNQNVNILENGTQSGLTSRKVKKWSEVVDPAARRNASISCQGILPLSKDGANKRKVESEFIIKKVSLDKCSRRVFKINTAVADAKKKKVEMFTREDVSEIHVETEGIKENVEKFYEEGQEQNGPEMLVDTEARQCYVKALVLRKEDIESNSCDHGEVEETGLEKKEAEIRNEVEVLQKLVDDKKKELQSIIKVQADCWLPPAEAYKENEQFYKNVFPKKWERLMRPLLHLVSPKVCKICIKEFSRIEEARVHFYTRSHVENHLEQIEKESVCKDFLPPLWRRELHMEPETIEDFACDAKFPW